jgi:glycosidase
MSKKLLILSLVSSFLLGSCATFNLEEYLAKTGQGGSDATSQDGGGSSGGDGSSGSSSEGPTDEEKEAYDQWLNSISKPNHLYFHYNRGDKAGYDQYCLWLWQHAPSDLEGTLWAYSGDPVVSPKLTLKPMSTHWMTYDEVQKSSEGSGMYKDDYGVIADVDLYKSGLIGGKTGSATSFEGANELGFLMVKQSSMDGSTNWTSDGGKETYIEDFDNMNNWRAVAGGHAVHIFVSTGSLKKYSYFAGSGVPQARTNPIDLDDTGKYSSTIDPTYNDVFDVSSTSESFKKLGVGYQIFVASFRDSDGDGYGDIRGIIDSLDYLEDLGVECLWLTPIQKSDSYHGYDISDYYAVDKRFGTIDDYRELIYKAHQKGMKVLMDLVLNHTSKSNVWFENSQWGVDETGAKNEWRDIYTWKYRSDKIQKANIAYDSTTQKYVCTGYTETTVAEDAASSNPSWYKDGESNYYYYGKFGSGMPEINYQNAKTRKLVIDMAKYWMSFGLDGYRLDAVKHIFMRDECYQTGDTIVTDVGQKTAYDTEKGYDVTKDFDYSSNVTKNVIWWKEFANSLKADYPNCFLVGENFDGWGTRTAPYYQALDSQFSFSHYYHIPAYLFNNAGGASNFASKQAAESYDTYASSGTFPLSGTDITVQGGHRPDFIDGAFTSNHDVMRAINQANGTGTVDGTTAKQTIVGSTDEYNKAKIHAAVTILNRGISWIYYGDELGMSSNTELHNDQDHYPLIGENNIDIWYRQPFLWQDTTKRANYRAGEFRFELDNHNKTLATAEAQQQNSSSMYNWYKDLIEIKKMYPDDARITYHPTSGNHVMVIRVNNAQGVCKLVIFINTGTGNGDYLMNPTYVANGSTAAATAVKTMNGAPANAGGNIGACPYGISVFQFD